MAERKTLLIPSLLDDWFPLLQYAFTSEEWEPVLLTEDDPHLAELGLKYFHNELCYPVSWWRGRCCPALAVRAVRPGPVRGAVRPGGGRVPGLLRHPPAAAGAGPGWATAGWRP